MLNLLILLAVLKAKDRQYDLYKNNNNISKAIIYNAIKNLHRVCFLKIVQHIKKARECCPKLVLHEFGKICI